MMTHETVFAQVKAKREAAGLKSTYVGPDGPIEMFHASEAHKAFYDFKYALRDKYVGGGQPSATEQKRFNELWGQMNR